MTNLLFEPTFGGFRGNVRTSSIVRWKARGRLPIRDNLTFFAISYSWDVISRYWSKSAHFRGSGSLWAQILGGRGRRSNHCWYQKTRVFLIPHSEDRVILCSFVWIGFQRVTDGRTDGQTDGIAVSITALCIAAQCIRAVTTADMYLLPSQHSARVAWDNASSTQVCEILTTSR